LRIATKLRENGASKNSISMTPLEKVEQLKAELDRLRPLDAEAEARIMQKFRLDWNYHSNNLEGNSLTYGETKALILFGITAQGKPLKDHFEITGHNEAINWILEIVRDQTELTEVFIRQLHTLLLKESSYKEAQTPDGKPTRRKIEVGKYKTQPNHVLTQTGETFYFAAPEETPAKMQELIEWFRAEKEKTAANPIILAALFHYKFIRIHPFDDGNGRVARILMNFILMQFGFPPAVIKTDDKENYFAVLRLADADQFEPFIEYIAVNLLRSLEIMIKGAKGESIEESEDLDKELALLERKLEIKGRKIEAIKSVESISKIIELSLPNTLNSFILIARKFDRFYLNSELKVAFTIEDFPEDEPYIRLKIYEINSKEFGQINITELSNKITSETLKLMESVENNYLIGIEISYDYKKPNRENLYDEFDAVIFFEFNEKTYFLSAISEGMRVDKLYSEELEKEEISKIVNAEAIRHKEHLEMLVKQGQDNL